MVHTMALHSEHYQQRSNSFRPQALLGLRQPILQASPNRSIVCHAASIPAHVNLNEPTNHKQPRTKYSSIEHGV